MLQHEAMTKWFLLWDYIISKTHLIKENEIYIFIGYIEKFILMWKFYYVFLEREKHPKFDYFHVYKFCKNALITKWFVKPIESESIEQKTFYWKICLNSSEKWFVIFKTILTLLILFTCIHLKNYYLIYNVYLELKKDFFWTVLIVFAHDYKIDSLYYIL